jgi:hypothetical protein
MYPVDKNDLALKKMTMIGEKDDSLEDANVVLIAPAGEVP